VELEQAQVGDHVMYRNELVVIRAIRGGRDASIRYRNRVTRWVPVADLQEVGDDDIDTFAACA
jgi:hypothetical protein